MTSNRSPSIKDDLRAKKTVRTTFKLSPDTVKGLAFLSKMENISLREVFNLLRGMIRIDDEGNFGPKIIQEIREADTSHLTQRKAYAISQETLDGLNEFATKHGVARDAILDRAIRFYLNAWFNEEERQLNLKQEALPLLKGVQAKQREALQKAEELLGSHDEIYHHFKDAVEQTDAMIDEITAQLREGNALGKLGSAMKRD